MAQPDIVKDFDKGYKHPEWVGNTCVRCGIIVGNREMHTSWHHELSLNIYSITRSVTSGKVPVALL